MKTNPGTSRDATARYGRDMESLKRGFAEHLRYDLARDRFTASAHDRFLAVSRAVRDRLTRGWIQTQQTHHFNKVKRVYYLSLEFLMGRALANNVTNLGIEEELRAALAGVGVDYDQIIEEEVDAGLGNGGLGRLAACFMESLATLQLPAVGYGIRYDFGIFRQVIEHGGQVEVPDDWLRNGNPWEIPRPDYRIPVHFGGRVVTETVAGHTLFRWVDTQPVIGIPYDTPIIGYLSSTVNTLRLWSARGAEEFDFAGFNQGDYMGAVGQKVAAENLTKVLYPSDQLYAGKELRLRQQYFFVACSLFDILRRFKKDSMDWAQLPDYAAIQLNDTHPALAVPELMRLLVDGEALPWEEAWEITVNTFGYTNHTLLPEALETWPVTMLEKLLPRHLQIIYEINRRFLETIKTHFPGQPDRLERMSLIQEYPARRLRMAHLCIVGSHSTNGVARLHTELLRQRLVPDFADLYPERFNSKTNGVTPRRWLLHCNPGLAKLISSHIGDEWPMHLDQLAQLQPLAENAQFRHAFMQVKYENKRQLAAYMRREWGFVADPASLFDVQIKRLHEYKRQLLNALHIVMLYRRMLLLPGRDVVPRTFIFSGKAAPGYFLAKLVIKFINHLGTVINQDPVVAGRLKVFFLPNYGVSLAERIIPAADLSEQISTAGKEASGTGNMKLMMNGALTIGTLDGANVEMLEEVGADNIFIFGLTAKEVTELHPTYQPRDVLDQHPEVRATLDWAFDGRFDLNEPGIFNPIRQSLVEGGDYYLHLADLTDYAATQARVDELYRDQDAWARVAILNVAASGKFSSDRTIAEYAQDIWQVSPVPVEDPSGSTDTMIIKAPDGTVHERIG